MSLNMYHFLPVLQRTVSLAFQLLSPFAISLHCLGTIRLWQTTPGKQYGLWQGHANGG